MGSKPLGPRRSQSSLPRPAASVADVAALRERVAINSALSSVNDSPACSSRSARTSPTCQARTCGAGNARAALELESVLARAGSVAWPTAGITSSATNPHAVPSVRA